MKLKYDFFKSADLQRKLYIQSIESKEKAEFQILITHGLGEHSNCYNDFANFLAENFPIKVIMWDLTGHGRSGGKRGYVGHINWMLSDLESCLHSSFIDSKLPLITFAHSLGGLLQVTAEAQEKFKDFQHIASIYSNPCLGLEKQVPLWKKKGAEWIKKLSPRLTLSNEISPKELSQDPEYLKEFKLDNYRHQKISSALFLGMQELMAKATKINLPPTPRLTLLSPNDPICKSQSSQRLLAPHSKLHLYPNSLHEILNDIEKEQAYADIKEFINEVIS